MDFYQSLSPFYDEMIDFEARLKKEKPFFKKIVYSKKIKSALDIGCGTGLHSILLSELGIESWGIDRYPEMIKVAKENAKRKNVKAKFRKLGFENWHLNIKRNFDSIFCLGNTLPHSLSKNKLKSIIKNVYNRLSAEGIFVIQILNYDRVMKLKERILSIKRVKNHTFIRFYDFFKNLINFNILILSEENKKNGYKLITTKLRPIYKDELVNIIIETGFKRVKCYSDFEKNRFYKNKSKDLVVIAEK